MIYKIDRIREDVRRIIDENRSANTLIAEGDTDTLELDELIEARIEDAARIVETQAPQHFLESGHNFGESVGWDETRKCGWTPLPDDFMRLVSFRMSDWERCVYNVTIPGTALYARQSSRFAGIRGTLQKPVCAIVTKPAGLVLEFWGCKTTGATVSEAFYLPYPLLDDYGGIDICERCYRAVIHMTGALVLRSYGEDARAQALEGISRTLISE